MKKALNGLLLVILTQLIFSSLLLAEPTKPAPFEPKIMEQIIGDYLRYHQEYKTSTPKPTTPSSEANQRRYVGILFKASHDAFEKNGYSYSATLNKLANNGFGFKTEEEVKKYSDQTEFFLIIFLGPKRAVGTEQLYRFNIYPEADLEDIMKLSYRLSTEDPTLFITN